MGGDIKKMDNITISCLKPILESMTNEEKSFLFYLSLEGNSLFNILSKRTIDSLENIVEFLDYYYEKEKLTLKFPAKNYLKEGTILTEILQNMKNNLEKAKENMSELDYINQLKFAISLLLDKMDKIKFRLSDDFISIMEKNIKNIQLYMKNLTAERLEHLINELNHVKDDSCMKAKILEEIFVIFLLKKDEILNLPYAVLISLQENLKRNMELGKLLKKTLKYTFLLSIPIYSYIKAFELLKKTFFKDVDLDSFNKYGLTLVYIHFKRKSIENFLNELREINNKL